MKNFRILAIATAVILALGSQSFAADKAAKKKTHKAPAHATPAPTVTETPHHASSSHSAGMGVPAVGAYRFAVNGPLSFVDGDVFIGPLANAFYTIYPRLEIGAETGFQYHPGDYHGWIIPLVAVAQYHLEVPQLPTLAPYVGAAMGLVIAHASVPTTIAVPGVSTSKTDTGFEGYVKGGSTFGADHNLFGEVRLGVMDGDFYFAPVIGMFF